MTETENITKSVLNAKLGGGPHGLGDPNDTNLRKVEMDVLIPKIIRDKARKEKCIPEVEAFKDCCKENSFYMVVACQEVNSTMKECLGKWYNDEDFKKQCTEEYLKERSQYRTTGISQKMKRFSM